MRAPAAAGGDEDALLCEILHVVCGGGLRCSADCHVFLGAHAAIEDSIIATGLTLSGIREPNRSRNRVT